MFNVYEITWMNKLIQHPQCMLYSSYCHYEVHVMEITTTVYNYQTYINKFVKV